MGKSKVLCCKVEDVIAEIKNTIDNVENEKTKICSNAAELRNAIEGTFDVADDVCKRKEKELKGQIDNLENHKTKVLNSQREFMQLLKDPCNQACLFSEYSQMYNNKAAFLEISQSILLRLHELINTRVDGCTHTTIHSFRCTETGKMLSFHNAVNSLASFTSTAANINGCQVSCPIHCLLDQECQVSITMVFVTPGSLFPTEKVHCIIWKDEKMIKEKEFLLSNRCQSAKVNWKCSETGMVKWAVHSNGIEIAKGLVCTEVKKEGDKLKSK
jgi:hypothetical protein